VHSVSPKVEQGLDHEQFTKGKSVNKSQLIEALAGHFDGNKKAAGEALQSVLDTIARELVKGEKVAITGFGAFEKVVRPSRMVRNPRTGERKRAKKTAVPKFKAGAELKAIVSGEKKLPKLAAPTKTAASKTTAAKSTASKASSSKTAAASRSTASKSTASSAAKSTARKTATKASPAKKAPATKTTAKSAAKKAPATKTTKSAAKTTTTAKKSPATKTTTRRTAKKS
jgi:DNA-binding protein HU-beta